MKKLLTVVLTLLLVGCASTEPVENVSYPVQTEQNVKNTQETAEPSQNGTESGTVSPDLQDTAENEQSEAVDAPIVEESAGLRVNRWIDKCKQFGYRADNDWASAYVAVIEDVCSVTKIDSQAVTIVYGPSVNKSNESIQKYVDSIVFSHTYWSRHIVSPDRPYWVIATQDDKAWWDAEYEKYVTETSEFTCPYFNENHFCSSKYYPGNGTTVVDSEVHLLVVDQTKNLSADAYIDPAHNAVHWYHEAAGYQHWHEFLIEGHATLYEIAFHVLENSNQSERQAERQRETFAWLSHTLDNIKFTATDAEGVLDHWDACYGRGYDCNHYYYGGGAMFHEKLVLEFGYASYLSWHSKLDSIDTISQYLALFQSHFGVSLRDFDRESFAPHAARSFNYYYSIW